MRNDAARQLRAGRSRSIGLVVLDVRNPFFTDIARGAEDAAAEQGMSLLVGNSDEYPEREGAYLDLFDEQRVSGVLISPVADDPRPPGRLRERGIPWCSSTASPRTAASRRSPSTTSRAAGSPSGTCSRRDGGGSRSSAARRRSGRSPTVSRARATPSRGAAGVDARRHPDRSLTVLAGRAAGEPIRERRPGRPDAIFAANDLLAIGLLQALMLLGGLRVPDDIALIGYDDIDFASATVVPLSSIRQPAGVIGHRPVDLLLHESFAEDDGSFETDRVLFQPELIVRRLTRSGPPR